MGAATPILGDEIHIALAGHLEELTRACALSERGGGYLCPVLVDPGLFFSVVVDQGVHIAAGTTDGSSEVLLHLVNVLEEAAVLVELTFLIAATILVGEYVNITR